MCKSAISFLFGIFIAGQCICQIQSPDLLLISKEERRLSPGTSFNIVVKLRNPTPENHEILLKTTTPPGLSKVMEYSTVLVEKEEERLKLIPIHIHRGTATGNYKIIVQGFLKATGDPIGEIAIPVFVIPFYEIDLQLFQQLKFISAGDSLKARFIIHNTSNTDVRVEIEKIYGHTIKNEEIDLKMNSHREILVDYVSDSDIGFLSRQSISINAQIKGKPTTKRSKSSVFDIIPTQQQELKHYHRIPVSLSTLMITDNYQGKQLNFIMFDIKGGGFINPEKKKLIEFQLRGPQRKGNPINRLNDRYYFKYENPKNQIILGDHNYRLSDLTEASRNGLGAGYAYEGKKIQVGGYINYPRYYPQIKWISSAHIGTSSSKENIFRFGVLHKAFASGENASLASISGVIKPVKWLNLDLELAGGYYQSQLTGAFRTLLHFSHKKTKAHLSATQAQLDFPGYYSNSRIVSAGLSQRFSEGVSISANYNMNHSNLALDTLFANSPYSQNIFVVSDIRILPTSRISFGFFSKQREDRTEPKLFDYEEYSMRISSLNSFTGGRINAYVEAGRLKNNLLIEDQKTNNSIQGNLSTAFRLSQALSVDCFVNYQYGLKYLNADSHRFYYGLSLSLKLAKWLKTSLTYQNNYQLEEYYKDRSLLALFGHINIGRRHSIGFGTNYHLRKNSVDQKGFNAMIKYSYNLQIRTMQNQDLGNITGTIRHELTESLQGVIVYLANQFTVTDEEGKFQFNNIPKGDYLLTLNRADLGLNTILKSPGPNIVTIESGVITEVNLEITKSASISGKIHINEDKKVNSKDFIAPSTIVPALIIEVKKEDEIFRVVSEEDDGSYSFTDLRPGDWVMTIYTNGIPAGYSLDFETKNIQLLPDQKIKLDIPINQKAIKIKIQKNVF